MENIEFVSAKTLVEKYDIPSGNLMAFCVNFNSFLHNVFVPEKADFESIKIDDLMGDDIPLDEIVFNLESVILINYACTILFYPRYQVIKLAHEIAKSILKEYNLFVLRKRDYNQIINIDYN